jgi:hypothetical protein
MDMGMDKKSTLALCNVLVSPFIYPMNRVLQSTPVFALPVKRRLFTSVLDEVVFICSHTLMNAHDLILTRCSCEM